MQTKAELTDISHVIHHYPRFQLPKPRMKTASLFMNGRSQAVRLPAEFRFESKRVFIYRDQRTGNVILSEKPQSRSWQDFMALRAQWAPIGKDVLANQHQDSQTRDPFADWTE